MFECTCSMCMYIGPFFGRVGGVFNSLARVVPTLVEEGESSVEDSMKRAHSRERY